MGNLGGKNEAQIRRGIRWANLPKGAVAVQIHAAAGLPACVSLHASSVERQLEFYPSLHSQRHRVALEV